MELKFPDPVALKSKINFDFLELADNIIAKHEESTDQFIIKVGTYSNAYLKESFYNYNSNRFSHEYLSSYNIIPHKVYNMLKYEIFMKVDNSFISYPFNVENAPEKIKLIEREIKIRRNVLISSINHITLFGESHQIKLSIIL